MSEAYEGTGEGFEGLLADALRPVEPPESLASRVEATLSAVTRAAASELSDWADELTAGERQALRDPRNWVRPVVATAAGGLAGTALVLVGLRQRRRAQGISGALGDLRDRLPSP